jgi:outer membrane receptor protein involved in Fe transport
MCRWRWGQTETNVTVTADAVQINTETSESGGTLSSKQIENLMVNGRDFQTMAIAIPGVSSAIAADSQTASQNSILIINGSGVETSTQTIDGVYNVNSGSMAGVNVRPTIEGIEEFTVLKDSYSAKYGIAGSGQVIVETKSGSKTFHGEVWDYLRNNAFDANNYFTTNQALHQNIYGYTLGGPVIIPGLYNKDRSKKTFFFASNQWYKIAAGQASRASVLPDAMRTGDSRIARRYRLRRRRIQRGGCRLMRTVWRCWHLKARRTAC